MEKLIFQLSSPGRYGFSLPPLDIEAKSLQDLIPKEMLSEKPCELPEISEQDLIRHFTRLSQKNFGTDTGFYPLGSCTMKYNPKINEEIANLPGFNFIHPYQPAELVQGALFLMYQLEELLCEITGMDEFSLQPAAGAHGELTAMFMMRAYFNHKEEENRFKILVPDSAHGTNPASASMSGFEVIQVNSDEDGNISLDHLKSLVDTKVACLMLTNPNTLGLFENNILEIADLIHNSGGLLYYDGANINASLGIARPGDMGFDIVHLNLHKTFSTPHGGGGPGSGPVGAKSNLAPFLPKPKIKQDKESGRFILDYDLLLSIGKVKTFYGNFLVLVKALAYIRALGAGGLKKVSKTATLNANYLMKKLAAFYDLPYKRICQHEFVLSAKNQKQNGVRALDIAKRLLDYGFHPPTIYFPLIVEEALMIEPTETESKQTLDEFIEALIKIAETAETNPELLKKAPYNMPVKRLDEAGAARNLDLRYKGPT